MTNLMRILIGSSILLSGCGGERLDIELCEALKDCEQCESDDSCGDDCQDLAKPQRGDCAKEEDAYDRCVLEHGKCIEESDSVYFGLAEAGEEECIQQQQDLASCQS